MGGVGKKQRFRENDAFPNVIQHTDFESAADTPAGRWQEDIFGNTNPIVLELACGKGEYSNALAQKYPQYNFIGVDIKGHRIWRGAKTALEQEINNVRYLRIYIDHLTEFFSVDEVQDIWITFPDPYLRHRDRKKRLTSPKFLRIYQQILKKEGNIRLKTDSDRLYNYTQRIADLYNCPIEHKVDDIYRECPHDELLTIKTYFERMHLKNDKTIKFIQFSLPSERIKD
jgi:tRNA (guanine-N7-)-methyltransferase